MTRNRYIKDYRLVEYVNERGRIRTDCEYIGPAYRFERDARTVRRAKKLLTVVCVVGWLTFVSALIPDSQGMCTLYVALPFTFAALPLGMLTEIAITAAPAKEPLERRHADKLNNRYPPTAMAVSVLTALGLAGELVCLLRGTMLKAGDLWFSFCALLLLVCGVAAFARRGLLAARED